MLLLSMALAGDILLSMDEETIIGGENYKATWARMFPVGDGTWHFFRAAGGGYQHHFVDSDGITLLDNGIELTGRTDLVDHAISLCPDGSFLHVASTNSQPNANDGAWAFRYDADLNKVAEYQIASADTDRQYNDAPAVCTGVVDGTLFTYSDVHPDAADYASFDVLGNDAVVSETIQINSQPNTSGSSMLWENESQTLLLVRAWTVGPKLVVDRYDADMNLVGQPQEVQITDSDQDLYWPQSMLRIDSYYFLAFMEREATGREWSTDTGNVWVAVFDLDFNLIERQQVTDYQPEDGSDVTIGAMQPWLARQGDSLLVIYDRSVQPTLTRIEVDPDLDDQQNPIVDTSDPGTDNTQPVADAGGNFNAAVGETIVLDGSASYDDDGDELTYSWSVVGVPDGSAVSNANLINPETITTSFVADVEGIYRVELTVADARAQATDTVVITVGDVAEGCQGCAGAGAIPGAALVLTGLLAVSRRR